MTRRGRLLIFGALLLGACQQRPSVSSRPPLSPDQPLILVSMDGFRWDYCDLYPDATPRLRQLKRDGVSARALIPVFPSNTFPNHYTIVTGLYPAGHGIVNNDFFDPSLATFFHYTQPNSVRDPRWWGGEPIWVTAIRQGRLAATSFWIGSEAEIRGVRPTFWKPYNYSVPFEKRLEELVGWLTLPPAQRPAFVAFYFEEANSFGHRYGPHAPELIAALKQIDGQLGATLDRLKEAGLAPNVIVVSDHGMAPLQRDRVLILEDYVDLKTVQLETDGTVTGLRPLNGDASALLEVANKIPHARAYRAEDLPARFHMRHNARVPPVLIVMNEGAQLVTRAAYEKNLQRFAAQGYLRGEHGYDPALISMHGIFIADGPAFRDGVEIAAAENIHVYNLLCATLGLSPACNDGDDRLAKAALRPLPER